MVQGLARDSYMREYVVTGAVRPSPTARTGVVELALADAGATQVASLSFQAAAPCTRANGLALFTGALQAPFELAYEAPERPLANGPLAPPQALKNMSSYRSMSAADLVTLLRMCGHLAAAETLAQTVSCRPSLPPRPLFVPLRRSLVISP